MPLSHDPPRRIRKSRAIPDVGDFMPGAMLHPRTGTTGKGRCQMLTRTRFRSGDACLKSDAYRFDGYAVPRAVDLPRLGELEISLEAGQTFPPIESTQLDCWWIPAGFADGLEIERPALDAATLRIV